MRYAAAVAKVLQALALLGGACILIAWDSPVVASLHDALRSSAGLQLFTSHAWSSEAAAQAALALLWTTICAYFILAGAIGMWLLWLPASDVAAPGMATLRSLRLSYFRTVFLIPPELVSTYGYSHSARERLRKWHEAASATPLASLATDGRAILTGEILFTDRAGRAAAAHCMGLAAGGALMAGISGWLLFAFSYGLTFLSHGANEGLVPFLIASWSFCGSLVGILLCVACALLKITTNN
jgi:hypothetical protein